MAEIEKRPSRPMLRWPEWFGRRWGPDLFRWPEELLTWPEEWTSFEAMSLEEYVQDGTLVVRIEMPGIDPDEDVDLSIADNTLTIRAQRREEKKEQEKHSYRSEFRYGAFVRRVPLPAGASEADVQASYKDGILEVRIPLGAQAADVKKVPISRS